MSSAAILDFGTESRLSDVVVRMSRCRT